MASQPGEGAVLQEKQPLPASVGEGAVNLGSLSNDATQTVDATTEPDAAAKSQAIKPSPDPEESGANHAAVGANGTLSPTMNGHPNGNGQPVSNGVAADHQESTPDAESQESQQPGLKVEAPATTSAAEQKPAETTTTPTTSGVESGTAALQLGSDSVDVKEDTKMESPILPQEPTQEPSGVTNSEQTQEEEQTTKAEAPSTPPQNQPSQTPQDTEMTPAPALSESVSEKPEQQPAPQADQPAAAETETETEKAVKQSPQAQEQKETAVATPEPTAAAATSEAKPQTPTQPLNRPDQEMAEAPPASPMKVARGRDEDASEEPAAKRAKTDDVSTESQFKVPDLPTASAASNGLPSTSKPISKLQTKFLTRCLVGLKRTHDSRFFRVPVDPIKLNIPSYHTIVKQPMDLGTIENKLRSGKYHTVDAVISDFKLMVDNSTAFNGTEHVVTVEGKNLFQTFERHLSKLPDAEQAEPVTEKKPKKAPAAPKATSVRRQPRSSTGGGRGVLAKSPTFALGPEGLPLIRRDSTTVDGRPKRSIHPPKNRELPYSMKPKKKKFQWELRFCQEVLEELHKAKYYSFASAFYLPVDPVALNIPTYHNIIKKPMDLSTVQAKLNTGQYENAKEMEVDVKQIFKNCYRFNIAGDPTYNAGKRLEDIFDAKWSQKGRWLETHEPSSGHQSAGSTDESDNDEEESDDGEQERLHLLQKQIEEMSKQVEAISKKKKSPPASKKSKSKPGKKDTKKASGAASRKDKKNTKPARPEKQRWVTYQEKQVISNGISSLPDKKMNEALRIIQQNVPSLKGSNETEIELDIDELPNDVLLMLLKFVKKHAPQMMEYDEPTSDPMPSAAPTKPKKSKPMNKYEQEQQIKSLQGRLSKFQGGDHSSDPVPEAAESSDDDEDSEESEEE